MAFHILLPRDRMLWPVFLRAALEPPEVLLQCRLLKPMQASYSDTNYILRIIAERQGIPTPFPILISTLQQFIQLTPLKNSKITSQWSQYLNSF